MVVDARELPAFGIKDLLDKAQDAVSVSRVFGEAYERDGAMVIPVASVRGGGGGGGGTQDQQQGEGGGFGLTARPVGAYVIQDGATTWKPAWDVNRLLVWGNVVAITAFLAVRSVKKSRG